MGHKTLTHSVLMLTYWISSLSPAELMVVHSTRDKSLTDVCVEMSLIQLTKWHAFKCIHFITGPPAHSAGGQTSNGHWRLSSIVVCNTPWLACRCLQPRRPAMSSCRLQSSYGSTAGQ